MQQRPGGSSASVPADFVIEFGRVGASSLAPNGAVRWNVEAVPGMDGAENVHEGVPTFTAPGLVGRPLTANVEGHAEVACVVQSDGLVPIAVRDRRLRMQGNGPQLGTLAFVGYGGGFHSLSPVASGGTVHVIYCPYDFDSDGVAQRAHAITLDPSAGNESVSVVHARGQAVLMQDDGSITMQSPDGQSVIKIENGAITLQAAQLVLNGGAVVIGNPTGAIVPLLAGPLSPACPRLFLNPAV